MAIGGGSGLIREGLESVIIQRTWRARRGEVEDGKGRRGGWGRDGTRREGPPSNLNLPSEVECGIGEAFSKRGPTRRQGESRLVAMWNKGPSEGAKTSEGGGRVTNPAAPADPRSRRPEGRGITAPQRVLLCASPEGLLITRQTDQASGLEVQEQAAVASVPLARGQQREAG